MHGLGADPLAVPLWDEYFAEGPFELPGEPLPGVEECVREGWREIFRLNEVRAMQWFRAALEKESELVPALVGMAVANHARPGRAAAAARRVWQFDGVDGDPLMREIAGLWRDSLAGLPAARVSDGASRAALLAGAGPKPFDAAEAVRGRLAGLRRMASGKPLVQMLLARELLLAGAAETVSGREILMEAEQALREGAAEYPDHQLACLMDPGGVPRLPGRIPVSPGAGLAWARRLERGGWFPEAAAWYGWAKEGAARLLVRMPGDADLMDWFHGAAEGRARVLASAGQRESALAAAQEAGWSCLRETALRLGAWDAIRTAAPRALREWAEPSPERAAWIHAQALAALHSGDHAGGFAGLALLRDVVAQVGEQPGTAGGNLAALLKELEWWMERKGGVNPSAGDVPVAERALPAARMLPLLAAHGGISRAGDLLRESVPVGLPERDAARSVGMAFPFAEDLVNRWARPAADPSLLPVSSGAPGERVERIAPDVSGEARPGRMKVILFFLGYRCDHCLQQLDSFVPWKIRFDLAGADLQAVSVDSAERVAETWAGPDRALRQPYPFPIQPDPSLGLFRAYRAWDEYGQRPVHATVVVDGAGRIRWQHRGTEPFRDAAAVLRVVEAALETP
jgi:peroxiredoxin